MLIQESNTCSLNAIFNTFLCSAWGRQICYHTLATLPPEEKAQIVATASKPLLTFDRRETKTSIFFSQLLHNRLSVESDDILTMVRGKADIPEHQSDFMGHLMDTFLARGARHTGALYTTCLQQFIENTRINRFIQEIDIDNIHPISTDILCGYIYMRRHPLAKNAALQPSMVLNRLKPAFAVITIHFDDRKHQKLISHALCGVVDSKGVQYVLDSNNLILQIDWISSLSDIDTLLGQLKFYRYYKVTNLFFDYVFYQNLDYTGPTYGF